MRAAAFSNGTKKTRFKLFNEPKTCKIVLGALKQQFVGKGLIAPEVEPTLCLAAGRFASKSDAEQLKRLFQAKGWLLIEPREIVEELQRMSAGRYENSVVMMTAKLLQPQEQ